MMTVAPTVPKALPLNELPSQTDAVVRRIDPDCEDIDRLQTLGVCRGRKIRVIKIGDPLIIKIYGSRIGLSASLARHVWLEKCEPGHCAEPHASCPCQEEPAPARRHARQPAFPHIFNLRPLNLLKSVLSLLL